MTAPQSRKRPERPKSLHAETTKPDLQRQRSIELNRRDSAPVIQELAKAGFDVEWISDLYSRRMLYKAAIPILVRWLPRITNPDVKESIVRALSVPWAKADAAAPLIDEFRKLGAYDVRGPQWAIGNALAVVADDTVYDDVVSLLSNPKYGKSREMLAVAMGNMKDPRAPDVLMNLLKDDEVAGHAIMALGKLRAKKAYSAIKPFQEHPKAWVRKEAQKALLRIEKGR